MSQYLLYPLAFLLSFVITGIIVIACALIVRALYNKRINKTMKNFRA